MKTFMMRKLLYIILFTVCSGSLFGQSGVLRGQVSDSKTGEPLVGVTITLAGSGREVITDFDGNFSFETVASGTIRIKVSYISYKDTSLRKVKVHPGQTTDVTIKMSQDHLEIREQHFMAAHPAIPDRS